MRRGGFSSSRPRNYTAEYERERDSKRPRHGADNGIDYPNEHQTDEFGRELRSEGSPDPQWRLNVAASSPVTREPPTGPRADRIHLQSPMPIATATRAPTDEYIALSAQEPSRTSKLARKLMILDLNGTLLRRSSHTPRSPRGEHAEPALRVVHPRAYLSTFLAFCFHPKTKQWLDTMVWSSAQPHSVKDMITRCFGEEEIVSDQYIRGEGGKRGRHVFKPKNLVAIWARDTLGLTDAQYSNKVLTLKDLATPWQDLPVSPNVKANELAKGPEEAFRHSALTTLLIDDSTEKAALQPYNHICVNEYDSKALHDSWTAKRRESLLASASANSPLDVASPGHVSRKAERGRAKSERVLASDAKMDRTMLALVGVLDRLKVESNVAAWIRHGGLWAGMKPDDEDTSGGDRDAVSSPHLAELGLSDPSGEDGELPGLGDVSSSPVSLKNSAPNATTLPAPTLPVRSRSGTPTTPPGLDVTEPPSSPSLVPPSARNGVLDLTTNLMTGTTTEKGDKNQASKPRMWFEEDSVVDYWCEEGRLALGELGIEVADGVVPGD